VCYRYSCKAEDLSFERLANVPAIDDRKAGTAGNCLQILQHKSDLRSIATSTGNRESYHPPRNYFFVLPSAEKESRMLHRASCHSMFVDFGKSM